MYGATYGGVIAVCWLGASKEVSFDSVDGEGRETQEREG